jgi:CheY-like chemotaxis protein
MCVLFVVDDDFTYQRIIKLMLAKSPVFKNVVNFAEGNSLLNYLNNNKTDATNLPDILFLDLNMPDTDGWAVLNFINKNYYSFIKPIKVYVVTVSIRKVDREKALNYTFVYDFISKPLYRDKIISIANSFYQKSQLED